MEAPYHDLIETRQKANKKRLLAEDIDSLYTKALFFAARFYTKNLSHVPSSPDPQELVSQAIEQFLVGERGIPDDSSVLSALCMVIRSIGSNFLNHNRIVLEHASREMARAKTSKNSFEKEMGFKIDYDAFKEYVDNDSVLTSMLDILWRDPDIKPRDLTRILGLPTIKVYYALRRLRKKAEEFTNAFPKVI